MPWSLADHPSDVLSVFNSFQPGYRLVDGGDLRTVAYLLFSVQEGADGGATQADAAQIENGITDVVDGTTFTLPVGIQGRSVTVINNSTAAIQVFGMTPNPQTGMIDTIAPAGSSSQEIMVPQEPGETCTYLCFAPGLWKQSSGLGAGTSGGPSGGIPEAPLNTTTYGRMNGTWVAVMGLAGGSSNQMQGPLLLDGQAATNPDEAVSLAQVMALAIDEGTY